MAVSAGRPGPCDVGTRLEHLGLGQGALSHPRSPVMLGYALLFLVIALIAGALGFFGVAGAATGIAKILFFVFLVLFLVSLIFGRRSTV